MKSVKSYKRTKLEIEVFGLRYKYELWNDKRI